MRGDQMLHKLCHKSGVFLKRNSSTILTCVGAVGVVATAVTAVRATPKALRMLEESKKEKGEELTKLEIVKVAGPAYIPTTLLGVSTIACVFGANVLNKRQQAALMSTYALLDNSFKEYKAKVKELYGTEADTNVRQEIAKDHYKDEDVEVRDNHQLFYEEHSKTYFESTMEEVIKAEYNLNRQLAIEGGVFLNDYYNYLNLPETIEGKELGWSAGILESMYWAQWIEFDHTPVIMDDGLECIIISMRYDPVIDFAYY